MRTVESLLTEAIGVCGGQSELARRIEMDRQTIHAMVKGERAISAETVALLGDVLELPGAEVQRLAAEAVIRSVKNASKRERLKRAFFGCWVAGVFVTTLLSGVPDARAGVPTNNTLGADEDSGSPHIHCRAFIALVRAFIRARAFAFAQALRGPFIPSAWRAWGALC